MHKLSIALTFVVLMATSALSAAENTFQRTLPAEANGAVRVSNVSGHVSIVGWERNEIEVKARLRGGAERVDVTSDRGRTSIRVVTSGRYRDGEAELDIRVPRGSDVDVSAVSAEVQTTRLVGPQRLTTVSGDIRAEIAADFEGKTVSGNMRLKGNSKPVDFRLQTVSGDITLERGSGELSATTVSGDLVLEMAAGTRLRMRTTSGDLSLRGSLARNGNVDAETISGDLTVRVKPAEGFEYEAVSFSGEISNCFGKHAERSNRYGPGSRLIGTAGAGAGRVRVKSMSGDVTICDR